MDRTEVAKKLRDLMAGMLEVEIPAELKETDRIYEDLGIDSIMVMQIMVGLEETFGISVPEEEIDPAHFGTVGSVVSFILELQGRQVST
ncbi:MAG: hypothetical protein JXD23_13140 [Spirochaetales bacterium]|nr:hypothetical protein [Spirochaetales bacterium]